jgi:hypothetical protein
MSRISMLAMTVLMVAGCSSSSSSPDACRRAAIAALPTWDTSRGLILDTIPQCKDISQTDRIRLRKELNTDLMNGTLPSTSS